MAGTAESIVIVGGGQAAARAAQAVRGAGHKGPVVLLAGERHLPYERPPLSKEFLKSGAAAGFKPVLSQAFYQDNGIDLRLSTTASEIDRRAGVVHLLDGGSVAYSRLLLATGGLLRRLPLEGLSGGNVFYLRTLDDGSRLLAALRSGGHLLVVGAGFIGLEIASAARRLGCEVTVIEAAGQILGRVAPPAVAQFVERRHRQAGVDVRLGVMPLSVGVDSGGSVRTVRLDSGDTLEVAAVAVGIGIVPDCGLATAAGLEISNGILVDACCRTSDPSIFAAGDVANQFNPVTRCHMRQESWQNAQDQGLSAGLGLAGQPQPVTAVPWAWSDQYDLNLQVAGTREPGDHVVLRGDPSSGEFSAIFLDGGVMRGAVTVNRGRDMTAFRRMLVQQARYDSATLEDEGVSLRELMRVSH